jgi:hypothetical protein
VVGLKDCAWSCWGGFARLNDRIWAVRSKAPAPAPAGPKPEVTKVDLSGSLVIDQKKD